MWVNPKPLFYFILQWTTLIGHSQKIMIFWYSLNISISTNMGLWWCYSKEYFEWTFLDAHFAPPHCLNISFIPNLVHHYFWLKILQKLKYLLWFILINSISCGPLQTTNVLMVFFSFYFFCNGLVGPSPKIYEIALLSPQVAITFFTLFYTIAQNHINVFVFTLTLFYMA